MRVTLKTVFPELTVDEIEKLHEISTPKVFLQGDVALLQEYDFEEGRPRRALFILRSGEIEIFRARGNGFLEHVGSRYENEILGEEMLLEPEKAHNYSCRTIVDSEVAVIRRVDIEKLFKAELDLARKIYRQLALNAYRRMTEEPVDIVHHESDSLGEVEVPCHAYYGSQTARALKNFKITGLPISTFSPLITSLALIKKAAARANAEAPNLLHKPNSALDVSVGDAIIRACDEIIAGNQFLHSQFKVDVIQGGAGTSTNMNANEVIAKRARELLGFPRHCTEHKMVDPNDDVNMSQSTNDVYPTALRLTLALTYPDLTAAMQNLIDAFYAKSKEFSDILKMGRTQLQDAVPMTLGQEFRAFAITLEEDIDKLDKNAPLLGEVNLGGTAIGTGALADPDYPARVIAELNELLQTDMHINHIRLRQAADLLEASWDTGVFVLFSGIVKRVAVKLSKICNDLRLLNSGPLAGFGDIHLPHVQPGSSIMPGKVNPVIPEVVNQVAFQVIGNDLTVTMASEAGQLQLNPFEPIIAFNILQSMQMMTRAMNTLAEHVSGITVADKDRERLRLRVEQSPGLATFLIPEIGYRAAASIAKEVIESGHTVKEVVLAQGIMSEEEWETFMRPDNLTRPYRPKR